MRQALGAPTGAARGARPQLWSAPESMHVVFLPEFVLPPGGQTLITGLGLLCGRWLHAMSIGCLSCRRYVELRGEAWGCDNHAQH
jgi:hypothetical protein